jgi:hypothetical protein
MIGFLRHFRAHVPALPRVAAVLVCVAAALAVPRTGTAESGIIPVQAKPDAKETAERFLAHLKEQGYEARHEGIEPAGAGGFRIKSLLLIGPDKQEWKAASFEVGSFEAKSGGEAALGAVVVLGLDAPGPGKSTVKIARITSESLTWAPKLRIAVRRLTARDFVNTLPPGDVMRIETIEVAAARLDGEAGGTLEQLAVRGVSGTGKDEKFSVASIDVASVAVAVPERARVKGFVLRNLVTESRRQGTIRMASLEVGDLEYVNVLDRNPADLRSFTMSLKGLELPITVRDGDPTDKSSFAIERVLRDLGYSSVKLNFDMAYRYDAASKSYELSRLTLDVADMAALTLAAKVGGLTPEEIKQALEPPRAAPGEAPRPRVRRRVAALGVLARLNLLSADLVWRDQSILNRLIKREAQQTKTDEASVRKQYRATLETMRNEQSDPLAKESVSALIAFLDKPGRIVAEIRPPAPVNLVAAFSVAAANPALLRGMLGIKIYAK